MTTTVSPEAAAALRDADATETTVVLHSQLDRTVYVEVNKVLTRIGGGGKWNRKANAHVYPRDPRPELAALLGDNPNAVVAVPEDKIKAASFWRTPPEVVGRMMTVADLHYMHDGALVLEPSAGDGAIADVIARDFPNLSLICIESDPDRAQILTDKGHRNYRDTFENSYAVMLPALVRFDSIVMNPPFTTKDDPKAWITHVDLALDLLKPGGSLGAVVPASYQFGTTRKHVALRKRITEAAGWYESLPDRSFRGSGTDVATGLVVVEKL